LKRDRYRINKYFQLTSQWLQGCLD